MSKGPASKETPLTTNTGQTETRKDLSAEAYFLGKSDSSLLVSSSIRLQV